MRRFSVAGRLALVLVVSFPVASAHNAGHVPLPDGTCVNVGSGKSGPFVPAPNPNRNTEGPARDLGRLDLMPGNSGDQYGARFAAEQGGSAVSPGHSQACRN